MNIDTRKLTDLIYAEYNPRKKLTPEDAEYQKIAKSINEFGYVDPIIINSDNTIIGGHQRVTVLKDMGWDEIQVVVLNISKEREKALNIALNKISGEWDLPMLRDLLLELDNGSFDLSLTGFDTNEMEELVNQLYKDDPIEDDNFDAESEYDSIITPITQERDIWTLGRHKVMCGDAIKQKDVQALMDGEYSQLTVTDPPYNVDYHAVAGSIENDNLNEDEFYKFLLSAFTNMYDTAEPGAALYVFHADSEGINFRKSYQAAGFLLKQCLIWVKSHFVLGRQDYQWKHEPILYGWKGGAAHFFIDDYTQTTVIDHSLLPDFQKMKKEELLQFITEYFESLDRIPQSIIYCDKPNKSKEHPTMKPVPLIGKLISNSSKVGWIVQDLFGGSGSTLIACEKLNRITRMMEHDPKFVDVIVKRYIALCKENGQEPQITLTRNGQTVPYDYSNFER